MTAPKHRTVPVEPTEEMYAAAEREWDGRMSARSAGVWRAMLEAAPPPPSDLPQSLRDRVVEVLRPFADKADRYSHRFGALADVGKVGLKVGDLRAAASLLLELKERGDG